MKKVVFLGSKKIGWQCLDFLKDHADELGVQIIQIGSNQNRKDQYTEAIKAYAANKKIPMLDKDDDILDCDFIISVQYHNILSAENLAKAKTLAINLHMAPLPEYRGCNQFSFAILDQATEFGTSLHIMDAQIDHGPLLADMRFQIPDDIWVEDLYEITENASLTLFETSISKILEGHYQAIDQKELEKNHSTELHYRYEIEEVKKLELDWPQEKIYRHIRATYMSEFPKPYFIIQGEKFEVHKS